MRCAQFVRSKKTDQPLKERVVKLETDLPTETQDTEDCDIGMPNTQQVPPSKTPVACTTNPTAMPLDVVSIPVPTPVQSEARSGGGRHLQPPTGNNSKLKHKCPFDGCTWRFATPYKLRRHLMSHTKETPYTCKECDRGFSVRYNLLMHIQTIHSQPFRFKCPVRGCKEGYPTQPKLNSHLKKVHKRDGKTMDIKPEPTNSALTNGSSAESKCSSHQCPECGKECGSPSKLATHIKTHSSDRPHKCTVQGCDKAFATKDRLTRHMGTHKNAEQFPCPHTDCTRVFIRQSHLQSHLKTHNQETFACRVVDCNEKFSTESEYNEHLNSHMNFEHRCPYKDCGQTFSVFKRLDMHCKMAHHTSVEEARSRALRGSSWPTTPPPLVSLPASSNAPDHHHSDPELTYIKAMPSNSELPDLKLEDIDTVISNDPAWKGGHPHQALQQPPSQEGFVSHISIKREPRVSMECESDGGYYSSPSMQSTTTSAPFSNHSISPVLTPVNLSPAIVSPCHCFFPSTHSFFHSPIPDTPSPREGFGFFRHPYSMVPSPLGTPDPTAYSPTFPPSYYSSVFVPMSPYADSHAFSHHSSIPCTMNPSMVRDSEEYMDLLCPAPSSPKFPCADTGPMIPPLIPDRQPKCKEEQMDSSHTASPSAEEGACTMGPSDVGCTLQQDMKREASSPTLPPNNAEGAAPRDQGVGGPSAPSLPSAPTSSVSTPTCAEKAVGSPSNWYQQEPPLPPQSHIPNGNSSSFAIKNGGLVPGSSGSSIGPTAATPSGDLTPLLPAHSQFHERKVIASILFTQPSTAAAGGICLSPSRDPCSSTVAAGSLPLHAHVKNGASRKGGSKGHKTHLNRTAKPRYNYQWPKSINSANLVAFRDYILKKLKKEPGEGTSSRSPCSFQEAGNPSHPQSPVPADVLLVGTGTDSMLSSSNSPCSCREGLIGSNCGSLCNDDPTTIVQEEDCNGLLPDLRPSPLLTLPSGFDGQDEIDTFLDDLENSRSVVSSPLSSENQGELYSSFVHSVEVDSDFEVTSGDLITRNLHSHFGSLHDSEQDSMYEIPESMGTFL